MATTAPDNISGWKFPNEDKKKKKNQQNTTYKTSQPTPSTAAEPINTSVYKNNGGSAKTSAPSVPYEDTVAQKNMQKEVQKAAQKAKQQPKSSLDVPYKTQQTVAQKRQQQKDEQWLSLGSAQGNTKNTGTGERQNAQSYSGKMEVRSPLTQKQWNSNVSSTAPKVQAEKNTADKFKVLSALPSKSTAPEWKNMGTDSPWNSTSTTSAQNISKQTERKIPAKSEPDFEKDFKEMWAKYGPRLMGTERTPKTSYGPNSEMANTVKINPQKNTVPKTVASPKPTVNAAGPSAEMGKAVKTGRKTVSDNIIDLSPPHYMTMFEYIDWINGIGPNKETASSVKRESRADLVASAQPKSPFQNPVLGYNDMINPPDETHRKDENFWRNMSYKDNNFIENIAKDVVGLNPAEIRTGLENILLYAQNMNSLRKAQSIVIPTRNALFHYNENEISSVNNLKPYTLYSAGLDGSLPNSFQHIFLAALLTDELGEKETRKFLTAHETFSDLDYDNNILAQQQEIPIEVGTAYYDKNKLYPTKKHHAEMDLHNNDLGIQISLSTPYKQEDIEKELSKLLDKGETIGYLRHAYPDLNDRQILLMKKALKTITDGDAAIIWDFPE